MRSVSDEELEQIRTAKGEKFEWKFQVISSYYGEYNKKMMYLPEIKGRVIMFQCLKCQQHYIHDECGNCGHTVFELGSGDGVYCSVCEMGFTSWNCGNCGARNPVSKTFFLLSKGGCFIATAAYGGVHAPEVATLRKFRDTRLKWTRLGSWAIRIYERFSPPLADWIAKHPVMRLWIRRVVLSPMVWMAHRWTG